eukprot:CAMPEP_0175076552 /NCGR_PEP_ID=MMETSP0052_2-20121109/22803_1 /TAXON_ID=51329 ORGANISM="Polytomella parva, Strain SAG 63-3" /NCGR_SAMPLE_ID=MMETSP0052_2 /ASSEMBLY_ACC=CAM_ASM_000194 /LENGTH=1768 /DNA_ID=CAMNT_0016345729 /DNA_START=85 /DNA_END=5391 /DNA_ORIENTATION=+
MTGAGPVSLEEEFATCCRGLLKGNKLVKDVVVDFYESCIRQADKLRLESKSVRPSKEQQLLETAEALEFQASTWQLLFCLFCLEAPVAGEGGCRVREVGGVKTFTQQAADTAAMDPDLRRCCKVLTWLELSAERNIERSALSFTGAAGAGSGLLAIGEGLWTKTRAASLGKEVSVQGPTTVTELDPDAPTRLHLPLHPDDSAGQAHLISILWRQIRAGRFAQALETCVEAGQPWRAVSLSAAGMCGPIPVGPAAASQDDALTSQQQLQDLYGELESSEGVPRALWKWCCRQVAVMGAGGDSERGIMRGTGLSHGVYTAFASNNSSGSGSGNDSGLACSGNSEAGVEASLYAALSGMGGFVPGSRGGAATLGTGIGRGHRWEDLCWTQCRTWLEQGVEAALDRARALRRERRLREGVLPYDSAGIGSGMDMDSDSTLAWIHESLDEDLGSNLHALEARFQSASAADAPAGDLLVSSSLVIEALQQCDVSPERAEAALNEAMALVSGSDPNHSAAPNHPLAATFKTMFKEFQAAATAAATVATRSEGGEGEGVFSSGSMLSNDAYGWTLPSQLQWIRDIQCFLIEGNMPELVSYIHHAVNAHWDESDETNVAKSRMLSFAVHILLVLSALGAVQQKTDSFHDFVRQIPMTGGMHNSKEEKGGRKNKNKTSPLHKTPAPLYNAALEDPEDNAVLEACSKRQIASRIQELLTLYTANLLDRKFHWIVPQYLALLQMPQREIMSHEFFIAISTAVYNRDPYDVALIASSLAKIDPSSDEAIRLRMVDALHEMLEWFRTRYEIQERVTSLCNEIWKFERGFFRVPGSKYRNSYKNQKSYHKRNLDYDKTNISSGIFSESLSMDTDDNDLDNADDMTEDGDDDLYDTAVCSILDATALLRGESRDLYRLFEAGCLSESDFVLLRNFIHTDVRPNELRLQLLTFLQLRRRSLVDPAAALASTGDEIHFGSKAKTTSVTMPALMKGCAPLERTELVPWLYNVSLALPQRKKLVHLVQDFVEIGLLIGSKSSSIRIREVQSAESGMLLELMGRLIAPASEQTSLLDPKSIAELHLSLDTFKAHDSLGKSNRSTSNTAADVTQAMAAATLLASDRVALLDALSYLNDLCCDFALSNAKGTLAGEHLINNLPDDLEDQIADHCDILQLMSSSLASLAPASFPPLLPQSAAAAATLEAEMQAAEQFRTASITFRSAVEAMVEKLQRNLAALRHWAAFFRLVSASKLWQTKKVEYEKLSMAAAAAARAAFLLETTATMGVTNSSVVNDKGGDKGGGNSSVSSSSTAATAAATAAAAAAAAKEEFRREGVELLMAQQKEILNAQWLLDLCAVNSLSLPLQELRVVSSAQCVAKDLGIGLPSLSLAPFAPTDVSPAPLLGGEEILAHLVSRNPSEVGDEDLVASARGGPYRMGQQPLCNEPFSEGEARRMVHHLECVDVVGVSGPFTEGGSCWEVALAATLDCPSLCGVAWASKSSASGEGQWRYGRAGQEQDGATEGGEVETDALATAGKRIQQALNILLQASRVVNEVEKTSAAAADTTSVARRGPSPLSLGVWAHVQLYDNRYDIVGSKDPQQQQQQQQQQQLLIRIGCREKSTEAWKAMVHLASELIQSLTQNSQIGGEESTKKSGKRNAVATKAAAQVADVWRYGESGSGKEKALPSLLIVNIFGSWISRLAISRRCGMNQVVLQMAELRHDLVQLGENPESTAPDLIVELTKPLKPQGGPYDRIYVDNSIMEELSHQVVDRIIYLEANTQVKALDKRN